MTVVSPASGRAHCGRPRRRVACLLLVGLMVAMVATTPGAAGQDEDEGGYTLRIGIDVDGTPTVAPITGTQTTQATLYLQCDPGTVADDPVKVMITVEPGDPWATVTVDKTQVEITMTSDECGLGAVKTAGVELTSSYAKDAPAYANTTHAIVAKLEDGTEARAEWREAVGFYGHYDAKFRSQIIKTAPGSTVHIPLRVENLGNGPLLVHLLTDPSTSDGLDLESIDPFTVPSPLDDPAGAKHDARIVIHAPEWYGYGNEDHTAVIKIEAASALEPAEALEPRQQSASITVQGIGTGSLGGDRQDLPAVGSVPAGLALLGLVAVARRSRS